MNILIVLILSAISGWLYWAGGHGKPFNSKYRDWGCSLLSLIALWLLKGITAPWWAYGLCFGLSWAALSTYWDFLTKLWRKSEDEFFENWLLHGFFLGLSFLPLAWFGPFWWIIVIRAAILGVLMMAISELSKNVKVEEGDRGGLIILTELLFLIK